MKFRQIFVIKSAVYKKIWICVEIKIIKSLVHTETPLKKETPIKNEDKLINNFDYIKTMALERDCKCIQEIIRNRLPMLCLVPREPGSQKAVTKSNRNGGYGGGNRRQPTSCSEDSYGPTPVTDLDPAILNLSDEYIRSRFRLPPRASYLDPAKRPPITLPINGDSANFTIFKKEKINQMILDGIMPAEAAISAQSTFPFGKDSGVRGAMSKEEEIIYILQLPDYEFKCPVHNTSVRTPRFIWHSVKKGAKSAGDLMGKGPGPLNKPKPWLLSRNTNFDLASQW